jgi:diacylglycerol kinase family enzyme
MAQTVIGTATKSPFVQATKAKKVVVELSRKVPYELDGGERGAAKLIKARVEPGALKVRVPRNGKREEE